MRPGVVSDAEYHRIYETHSGKVQRNDLRTWDVANTSSLKFDNGMTAKLILGYRDIMRDDRIDLDAQPTSGALYINYNTDVQQFTAEAQLLGDGFDERLDWIVGLYHYKERGYNEESVLGDPGLRRTRHQPRHKHQQLDFRAGYLQDHGQPVAHGRCAHDRGQA